MTTLTIEGKQFVLVPAATFDRLVRAEGLLPRLPRKVKGGRPAVATAKVILARTIIRRRLAAGWTPLELGKRAGLPLESINQMESGKDRPTRAAVKAVDSALSKAGV